MQDLLPMVQSLHQATKMHGPILFANALFHKSASTEAACDMFSLATVHTALQILWSCLLLLWPDLVDDVCRDVSVRSLPEWR